MPVTDLSGLETSRPFKPLSFLDKAQNPHSKACPQGKGGIMQWLRTSKPGNFTEHRKFETLWEFREPQSVLWGGERV